VLRVVPAAELTAAANAVAAQIAAKDPLVIRLAKQSLNGIDPVDVKRSTVTSRGSPTSSTWQAPGAGHGRRSWTGIASLRARENTE